MGEKLTDTMTIVDHREKKIFLSDYRGLQREELARHIRTNTDALVEFAQSAKGDLLGLSDVSGCYGTPEVLAGFKDGTKRIRPYCKATAVVGLVGLQRYLLGIVNRFSGLETKAFDTVDEAKDWLVEQTQT